MNSCTKEFIKSQNQRKLNFKILQLMNNKKRKLFLLIFQVQILRRTCTSDILDLQFKEIAFVEYLNSSGTMFTESTMQETGVLSLECSFKNLMIISLIFYKTLQIFQICKFFTKMQKRDLTKTKIFKKKLMTTW